MKNLSLQLKRVSHGFKRTHPQLFTMTGRRPPSPHKKPSTSSPAESKTEATGQQLQSIDRWTLLIATTRRSYEGRARDKGCEGVRLTSGTHLHDTRGPLCPGQLRWATRVQRGDNNWPSSLGASPGDPATVQRSDGARLMK